MITNLTAQCDIVMADNADFVVVRSPTVWSLAGPPVCSDGHTISSGPPELKDLPSAVVLLSLWWAHQDQTKAHGAHAMVEGRPAERMAVWLLTLQGTFASEDDTP